MAISFTLFHYKLFCVSLRKFLRFDIFFVENRNPKGSRASLGGIWEVLGFVKHLEGIWEAPGRHLGGIWEASGKPLGSLWEASGKPLGALWRRLGSIWEAVGAQGHLGAKSVQNHCVLQCSRPRATISPQSGEGRCHQVLYFTRF